MEIDFGKRCYDLCCSARSTESKAPSCPGGTSYFSLKSLLYSVEIILRLIAITIVFSALLLEGRREKERLRRSSWTGRRSQWSTPARDRCTALRTTFPFGPWTSATHASRARRPCTRRWRPRCWDRPSEASTPVCSPTVRLALESHTRELCCESDLQETFVSFVRRT